MKSTEIITNEEIIDEWSMTDSGIRKELVKKGYKFLGSGVDQSAYLEPGTGYVLKIFGTQDEIAGQPNKFSDDHKMFFTWAKFCMKNADNKFLPKFFGYESFVYKLCNYLQIRQEKLTKSGKIGEQIEVVGDYLRSWKLDKVLTKTDFPRLVVARTALKKALGNDEDFILFCKTIQALQKIGGKKGWSWDLHGGNVMLRGTTLVIVDPWVV